MTDWSRQANDLVGRNIDSEKDEYRAANAEIIRKAIRGIGLDTGRVHASSGIRVVYNVASAHIPRILSSGYKNCYDLNADKSTASRIGEVPAPSISKKRLRVDRLIAQLARCNPETIYYGALELNGAGMRFYGDLCMVILNDKIPDDCLLLYRNSYDLERDPIIKKIKSKLTSQEEEAEKLAGQWSDAPDMAVCKIMEGAESRPRLMTVGLVSEGVLADEDYIEVPRVGSFHAKDLAEVRTAASDIASEARIANRLDRGPSPTLAELLWRKRRRQAEHALAKEQIPLRVITGAGRLKG